MLQIYAPLPINETVIRHLSVTVFCILPVSTGGITGERQLFTSGCQPATRTAEYRNMGVDCFLASKILTVAEEGTDMRISQPLQPMAPLIALTLGSLSIVSLAQGIVTVPSHINLSTILEIIAGIIGLALTVWVIIAMRTAPSDDDDDDDNGSFDSNDDFVHDIRSNNTIDIER